CRRQSVVDRGTRSACARQPGGCQQGVGIDTRYHFTVLLTCCACAHHMVLQCVDSLQAAGDSFRTLPSSTEEDHEPCTPSIPRVIGINTSALMTKCRIILGQVFLSRCAMKEIVKQTGRYESKTQG